jgi:hypothetical protein
VISLASGLQQARQKENQRQQQIEENESPLLSASAMGLSADLIHSSSTANEQIAISSWSQASSTAMAGLVLSLLLQAQTHGSLSLRATNRRPWLH